MSYDANSIQKLDFPEAVQMRVGMYLGKAAKDVNSPGQMNVGCREILDNSVTESLRGKANKITLTFHKDGYVSCLDNGRGIPVDINKETGKNGIIMTMAELHSGGNFSGVEDGKAGAGLNGVGASVVNALSSRFDVEVYKGKFKHSLSFKEGIPGHYNEDGSFKKSEKIKKEKCDHEQGTNIRFKFEPRFFTPQERVIVDDIIDRCRYTVYLVDGLNIDIIDETRTPEEGGGKYHFENVGGMSGMIDFISTGDPLLSSKKDEYTKKGIFSVHTIASYKTNAVTIDKGKTINKEETRKIPIDVAFRFNADDKTELRSFANCIYNVRGGVHEEALKDALMDTFGKMTKDKSVGPNDVLEGMNACISVNVRDPQFDGQSKANLSGADVGKAIYSALIKELKKFASDTLEPKQLEEVLKKIKNNAKARQAAEVAKITKKKSLNKNSSPANLPSKLKECDLVGDDLAELYLCEGDSASGTIKSARDSTFQAILPLRGKVLNVMKTDFTKKKDVERFNNNGEINDMIKALGAGVGEHFDINKIRYGKVFIACFTGDTKIKTPTGSISFKELVDANVKSFVTFAKDKEGNTVLAQATNPRITKRANKIVELRLNNRSTITCTPEHKFLLLDGTYKEAQDLLSEDLLMGEDNKHINVVTKAIKTVDVDVYDVTVETYHNFLLDSGVYVHNCDEDVDGQDISVLILGIFYRIFKPMIEDGRLYKICSPLFEFKYRANGKEQFEYAVTEKDRIEIEKRLQSKNIKYKMMRSKGLGELNADVFAETVLNPETRRVKRITMEDAKKANDILELAIGNVNSDLRKQWMLENFHVAEEIGLDI